MTPLSDALTAAQRSALAALEKAYVAGQIEAPDARERLDDCGISDPVDIAFLFSALDVLREWGVSAPTMTERLPKQPEFATEKQQTLISDLCERKNQPVPAAMGALTKASASEIIDSLQKNGTYDLDKFGGPF
jgi:hypothetical protein